MRIDSHHSYSERYALDHLGTILKRNRFDGSVLITASPIPTPDFVRAIVIDGLGDVPEDPRVRSVRYCVSGEIPDFTELEKRGLSLDLSGGLESVGRIAERHPALAIVIDDLGQPIRDEDEWARLIAAAAEIPQVCCKLSGLTRIAPSPRPFVQHGLRCFGPDRLMFGSDWPASLPDLTWKANLAAFTQAIGAQPIDVRERLLGETARRFYRIPEEPAS